MWIGILYGILIWQFIIFAVQAIWDDDDKTFYIGAIIPFAIYYVIYKWIMMPTYIKYVRTHYNQYKFYHKNACYFTVYMKPKMASKFIQEETQEYYVKLSSEGKIWKSVPNFRSLYRKGIPTPMSEDVYNKFLK